VYNRTSSLISVLLIGSVAAAIPTAALAQISGTPPCNGGACTDRRFPIKVAQASTQQVKMLLDEGRRMVNSGDYNGAIRVYQEASSLEPKNASIYSGIGYLYAQQGNYSAALAAYRRAVALNPNNGDYQYALAYVSGSMGDNNTAKDAYRKSIQADRQNVNAYIGLALILLRLGEYDSAKWAYEQIIELDPKNPQANELRSRIFMKRG